MRNASPRLVSSPVVEVDLPAGAELDERARGEIGRRCAASPDRSGRTLTLTLRPLRPGGRSSIELPLRWSVSGQLRGLGAIGYAADRPESVVVLPSRVIEVLEPAVAEAGGTP